MGTTVTKGSLSGEDLERLFNRAATSLKDRRWADGSIFCLTQSGTTTALNNSCTDMPLSFASAAIVLNDSSCTDSMNFAITDNPRPYSSRVGWVYNNLYTIHPGGQELLRLC